MPKSEEEIKAQRLEYRRRNKERLAAQQRQYYRDHHEERKAYERKYNRERRNSRMAYNRQKLFGLSPSEYEQMVIAQSGVCKICGQPPSGRRTALCVDHDHNTGQIRGLLCSLCNVGLGHFKDSPELLQKAIDYLQGKA